MPDFVAERKTMTFLDPATGEPTTRGAEIRVDPLTGDTVRVFDFPFRVPPRPDLDALDRATRDRCPFCAERLETGPDGRVFIYRGSTTGLGPSPTVTLLGASRSLIGASLARVFRLSVWPGG